MIWLLCIAALIIAYFAGDNLRRIGNAALRRPALIILALLPLLGWTGWAWSDGCLLFIERMAGDNCYGFGMGIVMLFPIYGAWAFASLLGYFYGKRVKAEIDL
jgi:hypothetical protein